MQQSFSQTWHFASQYTDKPRKFCSVQDSKMFWYALADLFCRNALMCSRNVTLEIVTSQYPCLLNALIQIETIKREISIMSQF
jgi:hypothetical protein